MEDALVLRADFNVKKSLLVLILVLMEDALVLTPYNVRTLM